MACAAVFQKTKITQLPHINFVNVDRSHIYIYRTFSQKHDQKIFFDSKPQAVIEKFSHLVIRQSVLKLHEPFNKNSRIFNGLYALIFPAH